MGQSEQTAGKAKVMVKASYSWGNEPQKGVGLVTSLAPRALFVHSNTVPPASALVRLRMPHVGTGGAVELRGTVTLEENQKLGGFHVTINEFIQGEVVLLDFLGVSRSDLPPPTPAAAPPPPEPAPAEILEGELTVRIGVNRAEEPGLLVDIGDSGLYVKTGPGGPEPWQLKQSVRLELGVPMGHGIRMVPVIGRVVRIDPPSDKPDADPSWGVGVQFREGHAVPQDIVRRVKVYLARDAGERIDQSELWDAEGGVEGTVAGTEEEAAPRPAWSGVKVALGIAMVLAWLVLVWFLIDLRFESLIGPRPDPSTLPKPP